MIIGLFPIPGFITNAIQAAQKKKMEKTDARIQLITEGKLRAYIYESTLLDLVNL